jgi:hypothetical protein
MRYRGRGLRGVFADGASTPSEGAESRGLPIRCASTLLSNDINDRIGRE